MGSDDGSSRRSSVITKTLSLKKKDNNPSSPNSITSTESGDLTHYSLRSRLESATDKLRLRDRNQLANENDEPRSKMSGEGGLLSKLMPHSRKAKREDARRVEEERLGHSVADTEFLEYFKPSKSPRVETGKSEAESSPETDESDEEPLPKAPPTLSSHSSHIGYLTLSSPMIQNLSPSASGSNLILGRSPNNAPEATSPESASNLSFRHASTIDTTPRSTSPSKDSDKSRGSVSPVVKLKDVFSKRALSPNLGIDRASTSSDANVSGRGGLFGRKIEDANPILRKSSVGSRRLPKFTEDLPPMPTLSNSSEFSNSTAPSSLAPKIDTQFLSTSDSFTPATTITPPTPTNHSAELTRPISTSSTRSKSSSDPSTFSGSPETNTSHSGNMISHRRVRSASNTPSKLSNAISAPLTPTIEESTSAAPPLGTSPSGGGFFSSVFSAAQNAATSLSNSISLAPGQGGKNKGINHQSDTDDAKQSREEVVTSEYDESNNEGISERSKDQRLAVETLGMGSLSLSHLGISTENLSSSKNKSISGDVNSGRMSDRMAGQSHTGNKDGEKIRNDGTNSSNIFSNDGTKDENPRSTLRGASGAYAIGSEKPYDDDGATPMVEDGVPDIKPRSIHETSTAGDQTPPRSGEQEIESAVQRSGSVRSLLPSNRRKRGSSGGTSNKTPILISPSSAVSQQTLPTMTPRLTGFAVASKKRNRDFHQLFRSVPEDDYLIEDYSAAIQKEILLHGRLYVSEGHICFNSNVFGWVTNLVINFDEVVSLEKKSTAVIFPNAIIIQTLQAKNIFASFVSRDSTYDLLVGIWKISHPSLRSSLNGVALPEAGGGDKTEKIDGSISEEGTDEESNDDDEIYDEDQEEEGDGSFMDAADGSITASDQGDMAARNATRKSTATAPSNGTLNTNNQANNNLKPDKESMPGQTESGENSPGPTTHSPTQCSDQESHYDKIIKDEVILAPLGRVYDMIFGPSSGAFMSKWLSEEQKILDLQMEDDKKGIGKDIKSRFYSYVKPLNASIGPKQTKCLITENIDAFDLEKAVSVTVVTQTPDVPNGNLFSVKTKYCLTWAENNSTRLLMNCTIEWTGKSWLKSPIEKGANDGQLAYAKDLCDKIRSSISARPRAATGGSKEKGNKINRRRKNVSEVFTKEPESSSHDGAADTKSKQMEENWGLLEPFRGLIGPFVDILRPVISGNLALGLVVVLVLTTWFRYFRLPSASSNPPQPLDALYRFPADPERIAAYEEIWRQEESNLWEWLEDRMSVSHMALSGDIRANNLERRRRSDDMQNRLKDEAMSEREMEQAIRVTEERLGVLKQVMERRKLIRNGGKPVHDENTSNVKTSSRLTTS
ncbi:MAG: hypothetical protein M1829_005611 [Trizodia sp. TS-e1964]|nr:MAG: hypothetical protein M1829_005611 [Trizodia sp. TS-e1964]